MAKQLRLLKSKSSAYGGDLLKTRKGRAEGRPLSTRHSMHLVLRSTKARGEWSLLHPHNRRKVAQILKRFAERFHVHIYSSANVGNHLHIHLKLSTRASYRPFIRALTAAIAMSITGASRWRCAHNMSRSDGRAGRGSALKFWDRRPFSRIVTGFSGWLTLNDYIKINHIEGRDRCTREQARMVLQWSREGSLA